MVPAGIYLTGALRLRSGVELYLESGAILKGSRDPEDYFGYMKDTLEPVEIEEIGNTPKTCRSAISTSRWSNGLIRAKEGLEHFPLFVAANFDKIIFENCTVEGWDNPEIWVASDGIVEQIGSTPIKVRKATWDECIEAHPWGIAPEDRGKNRTFV